ncbi:MAG: hypothetical protein ACLFU8_16195, partial [Anaerolineales bacterium]
MKTQVVPPILILDHDTSAGTLREMLERLGYATLTRHLPDVRSLQELHASVRASRATIVVLDNESNGADDLELL